MTSARPSGTAVALVRGLLFFGLWLALLPSAKPDDLGVGVLAAVLATWLSLRLLPPAAGRVRIGALMALLPHFLLASVRAGVDVARRAFDPQLPVDPGFVEYPTDLPPGQARDNFAAVSSLLPGTVPVATSAAVMTYHCLDRRDPVVAGLAAEERRFAAAFIAGVPHG